MEGGREAAIPSTIINLFWWLVYSSDTRSASSIQGLKQVLHFDMLDFGLISIVQCDFCKYSTLDITF